MTKQAADFGFVAAFFEEIRFGGIWTGSLVEAADLELLRALDAREEAATEPSQKPRA